MDLERASLIACVITGDTGHMSADRRISYQNGDADPLFGANHLTLIRWVLASLVAISHVGHLARHSDMPSVFGILLGDIGVNGFFIVSGMLIAKSLHARRDIKSFTQSRLLRVLPALIVVTLSFPLFFSPLFSANGGLDKVFALENWQYVLRVLTLGDPENAPGGIFAGNSYPDFNTPLWTIRIELLAYAGAAFIFFTGLARDFIRILALNVLVSGLYLASVLGVDLPGPEALPEILRLSSCFLLGMLIYYWPASRLLGWRGAAIGTVLFLVSSPTFLAPLTVNIALAGLLLAAGLPKTVNTKVQNIPDYSYGIYIWHCPVMQVFIFLNPEIGPIELLVFSAPIFIALAAASWYIIERPALKLKTWTLSSRKTRDATAD